MQDLTSGAAPAACSVLAAPTAAGPAGEERVP
jgi:hypothetical protein